MKLPVKPDTMNTPTFMPRTALLVVLGLMASGVHASRAEEAPRAVSAATPAAPVERPEVTQALKEVDEGLAAFEKRMNEEASPVTKAAMKTRLVVLTQRRTDLAKRFSPDRYAALMQDLGREVSVTAKSPPPADADQGSARKPPVTLDTAMTTSTERYRAEAEASKLRDEMYKAERAAEAASQRKMDVAQINSELANLSAKIDSATVGNAQKRAELNQRLRELEQDRMRLEMSPNPAQLDQLRLEIQRETERAQR